MAFTGQLPATLGEWTLGAVSSGDIVIVAASARAFERAAVAVASLTSGLVYPIIPPTATSWAKAAQLPSVTAWERLKY